MLIKKISNVGFDAIHIRDQRPVGIDELARYPVFPPDFVQFLRRVIPEASHAALVRAIVLTARKPVHR